MSYLKTTIYNGNSSVKITANANVNISSNGQANILSVSSDGTNGLVTITGNISANNFTTAGSSGNISGANVITANTLVANSVVKFGGIQGNVISVATDTTLSANNYFVLATANANITLPAASSGAVYIIKNSQNAVANIIVAPTSGTIDGGANYTIAGPLQSISVITDGSNWYVN
jgi:hypothetical protein